MNRFGLRPLARASSALALLTLGALALAACGGVAPEVAEGADQAVVDGRSVWIGQCANCHGADGGGGRGPKLSEGRVLDRFPDPVKQEELILNGRGGMPSFAGRLSDEDISNVVRYSREVLAVQPEG